METASEIMSRIREESRRRYERGEEQAGCQIGMLQSEVMRLIREIHNRDTRIEQLQRHIAGVRKDCTDSGAIAQASGR